MDEATWLMILCLMLVAPAILLVRWALRAETLNRPSTYMSALVIAALTALFWLLARWGAEATRPVLPDLAAIFALLLVMPLAFGLFPRQATNHSVPPSYVRSTLGLYDQIIPLLIYCLAFWLVTARISIVGDSPLADRFWIYTLCLAPALFKIVISDPRPLQDDTFLALCLEWLYAAGCWGLLVFSASVTPSTVVASTLDWAIAACAAAGLLWAFLTGRLRVGGRAARTAAAGALAAAYRGLASALVRSPRAIAARLLETGEVLVFGMRALGRALLHLPPALGRAVCLLVGAVGRLLIRVAEQLPRVTHGLALASLAAVSAAGRGLRALPGATWLLLSGLASALAAGAAAASSAIHALPSTASHAAHRVASASVAFSVGFALLALASIRWLRHAVTAAAGNGALALRWLGQAIVASLRFGRRGVRRTVRALGAGARAIGRAFLSLPPALWRAQRSLAAGLASLLIAMALLVWEVLRWIAGLPLLLTRMLILLGKGVGAVAKSLPAVPGMLWYGVLMLAALLARLLHWLVWEPRAWFRRLQAGLERWYHALRRTLRAHPWAPAVVLVPSIAVVVWTCQPFAPPPPLRIVAGSGFSSFEPILMRWGKENGVDVEVTYKGSLDIMLMLEDGSIDADAIWEGDSLWTSLGDKQHLVKNSKSIMCSPIVFGVKRSIAQELGWLGRQAGGGSVTMQEILDASERHPLRVLMTSASQSNSGASAYFGFLYAFAGQPDVLTAEHLTDSAVGDKVRRTLARVDRTSESSGWMRDYFLANYARYDAMFNYESHILEMNQSLAAKGEEPLYIVYPAEGLGIADFPFSFVSKDNAAKAPLVEKLQTYLLSGAVQKEMAAKGRRVGPLCDQVDPSIFRSEWGADAERTLNAFKFPAEAVIRQALMLYQTRFRKPSFTVYCLDFSGSMAGEGQQKLTAAMRTLLDQERASKYLLQGAPGDVTVVLTFDQRIINGGDVPGWTVRGNNAAALEGLLSRIERQPIGDSTNIYQPVARALTSMREQEIGDRFPAIILMTDGQSNSGPGISQVKDALAETGLNYVPVFGITFGQADTRQLNQLAELTGGRVFDGTKDLVSAFRKAKGNN